MIIKVCGITNADDARAAIDCGATHLGLIFAESSPRFVTPQLARPIVSEVGVAATTVGVFRGRPGESETEAMGRVSEWAEASGVAWIQLHGGFDPGVAAGLRERGWTVVWAVPVDANGGFEAPPFEADWVLLDRARGGAFGGTGEPFDWAASRRLAVPFLVAGGLTPENVGAAVRALRPQGVDLSSGVEASPGRKSPTRLRALAQALDALYRELPELRTADDVRDEDDSIDESDDD